MLKWTKTRNRGNKIAAKVKIHPLFVIIEKLLVVSYKIYLLESVNPKMSIN